MTLQPHWPPGHVNTRDGGLSVRLAVSVSARYLQLVCADQFTVRGVETLRTLSHIDQLSDGDNNPSPRPQPGQAVRYLSFSLPLFPPTS